jgi:hypothetical protein
MQFSLIPSVALVATLLTASVSAWESKCALFLYQSITTNMGGFEVTIYDTAPNCDPDGLTAYRILSGVEKNVCYDFDMNMDGVQCQQYTHGGAQNGPCTSDSLMPMSAIVNPDGPAECSLSWDYGCGVTSVTAPAWTNSCQVPSPAAGGAFTFKSFKCTVSSFCPCRSFEIRDMIKANATSPSGELSRRGKQVSRRRGQKVVDEGMVEVLEIEDFGIFNRPNATVVTMLLPQTEQANALLFFSMCCILQTLP